LVQASSDETTVFPKVRGQGGVNAEYASMLATIQEHEALLELAH
jgi:hypothetical protein